jgi:thiaminase
MSKRKTISAIFNEKEVEAIEKTCAQLGVTKNKLVQDAVAHWVILGPTIQLAQNTNFGKMLKSMNKKMQKTKSIDEKQYEPILQQYIKKYGSSEFEKIEKTLIESEENANIIRKKKDIGRPKNKKKRRKFNS